jgi:hypothetical protein
MNKATRQAAGQKIEADQWIPFLAEFTREYRGAHVRLEVLGPGVGYQVETNNRPFDGVAADIKDGENTAWIHFGTTPADHHVHGVHNVTAIWLRPPSEPSETVLDLEAEDGTRTLLTLSRPEDYALPPATPQERGS